MKKFLKIAFTLVFVIIITIVAVPYFLKDDIEKFIKEEINNSINAKLDYDSVDLSLLRDFPNLHVKITNLVVDGINEFKNVRLAHIDRFNMSLDFKRLFFEKDLEIKKIGVDGADLNILVLKNGKANYDISKPDSLSEKKSEKNYVIKLKSYDITNSNIKYVDSSLNMQMSIQNLQHHGQGVFTKDTYKLKTKSHIDTFDVNYDGIHYLNKVTTDIDASVFIEDDFNKYTIKDGKLRLNELPLQTNLMIALKGDDDIDMDINYQTEKNSLKKLLSLVPKAYMPDFKGLKADGQADLKGYVKGVYNNKNYPSYGVDFKIKNGQIKYPDLPQNISNINVVTKITFPGGNNLDLTKIDMPKIHFNIAGNPADGRLTMSHPMSDPYIDTYFKTDLDLAQIKKAMHLPGVKQLSGQLKADMTLTGKSSAIEKQQFDRFKADGYFDLTDMVYSTEDLPYTIKITQANANISPQALEIKQFHSKIGQSDFNLQGKVTNYITYFLKKNQKLQANFDLHSDYLNINEFMSSGSNTKETTADSLIRIPKNIDVTFKADANKVLYKDMTLNNLKGQINIKDQKAVLNTVLTQALGGNINLKGIYDTSDKMAKTALNLSMQKLSINESADKLTMFKTYAPIMKKINGRFFSDLQMDVTLDQHMNPVLQTLDASGVFKTANIGIGNVDIIKKIGNLLKINELNQAKVDKIKAQFEIQKGKMHVKPFKFKINNMQSALEGSVGLDHKINFILNMDVPRQALGNKANEVLENLLGKAKALGLKTDLADIIKMKFKITGDYNHPKITPVIAGTEGQTAKEVITQAVEQKVEEAVDDAKEKAKAEAQKQADALIAQAQMQADKLNAEAKKQADKLRAEARKQADKLIKEAGNDPFKQLAAKALAKKLIKEADKKAKAIETKAQNQSNLIMQNARNKADALLSKFN